MANTTYDLKGMLPLISIAGNGKTYMTPTTVGLMPFATPSNKSNPNKFWFSPVWHTEAKLATCPHKALRLVKFDVTCGSALSSEYKYDEPTHGYVYKHPVNNGGAWIHSFLTGYYSNGKLISGYYEGTVGGNNMLTSPYWYRDFCGNYYTGSTATSGCFMNHRISAHPSEMSKFFSFQYRDTAGVLHPGYCKQNGVVISRATSGQFTGWSNKPYGFLLGLGNSKIWPNSKMYGLFGVIFAVPKANTIHSAAMYIKSGKKYDLYPGNTYLTYPYAQDKSHVFKLANMFSGTDATLSARSKLPHTCRLISVDSTYKYFVIKGQRLLSSANNAIITPPFVAYSGNSTGLGGPSFILDSWIAFNENGF